MGWKEEKGGGGVYNLPNLPAGEDVGHYGGSYKVTYDLYKKYGEFRLLDTPICGACTRILSENRCTTALVFGGCHSSCTDSLEAIAACAVAHLQHACGRRVNVQKMVSWAWALARR
jgi:hypothetical protein